MRNKPYKSTGIRTKLINAGVVIGIWNVVHHKDGNSLNNDPENLEIIPNREHEIFHKAKKPPEEGLAWCNRCKQFLPIDNFYPSYRTWNNLDDRCKKCKSEVAKEWRLRKNALAKA